MPYNGSGTFNLIFNWEADAAAGIDISASRMDGQEADIATGLSTCITTDGQSLPTSNLPMANFRHTGVGNGVLTTDYASLGQSQSGLPSWAIATGTADAIAAAYSPAITALVDGQIFFVRALQANATTTPTFSPNGLTPHTITKLGGSPLAASDIAGDFAEIILRYNLANTRYELLNPSNVSINPGLPQTGTIWLTIASTPPSGWLMFDDGTFGSASSGSSNSNSAANQALFNILYATPFTDATCPLLTSSGAGTTRAAQGSAAAAWAANCRMTLPKMLGRALGVAGAGSGLTSRTMGLSAGSETQTLITANLPAYTPSGTITNGAISFSGAHTTSTATGANAGMTTGPNSATSDLTTVLNPSQASSTFTGSAQGGTSTAFSIVQPEQFLNCIVKQ